ncbi:MAG: DMT family transporter [Bacteroidetes bacterium]|nr:DMT family transporter [Bacteroidota bacterium]
MLSSHIGEFAALATAFFWTITALSFERASIRVGSLAVNLLRMALALVFLSIFSYIHRGIIYPVDASAHAWFWLVISGLVGFVLGDYMLFESFTIIGSRISMLIMTLVPPITAFVSWLILGEVMSVLNFIGMMITLSGIVLVVFGRSGNGEKIRFRHPVRGILLAFGGAVGQAVGLVLSKYGMASYDAFAASQIRVTAGLIGFAAIILISGRWFKIRNAVGDRKGMRAILLGSFFGPFLGVSFSLFSVQHTEAGIASTIMAMVPVFIIAPAVIIFKQKVTLKEIIGAVLGVGGVVVFFI